MITRFPSVMKSPVGTFANLDKLLSSIERWVVWRLLVFYE